MSQLFRDILICLVAAHVLADFIFQTDREAVSKSRVWYLLRHGALVAVTGYVICGIWVAWRIPLYLFVTHIVIDSIKANLGRDTFKWFIGDQAAHGMALVFIGFAVSNNQNAAAVAWTGFLGTWYLKGLVVLAGGVTAVFACGYAVALAVRPLLKQIREKMDQLNYEDSNKRNRGLINGGQMIGQMERLLLFLFVIMNYPSGIGFLLAAKSILRFGEIKEVGQRMEAEYIIIGTLISFGSGTLVAAATQWVLARLPSV